MYMHSMNFISHTRLNQMADNCIVAQDIWQMKFNYTKKR